MRRLTLGVAIVGAASILAGCADEATPGPSQSGRAGLSVGVLVSQTGDLQTFGKPILAGVQLAADEINDSGGVNGQPVALIVEDDATDEQVAFAKVQQLVAADVSAIIGPSSSRLVLTVVDSVVGAGVVECSPGATAPELTDYRDNGFFFRTATPDTAQGLELAALVLGDGHKTASVVAVNDPYGQGLANAFVESYEAAGGRVTRRIPYDPKGTNFNADAAQALRGNPQALVLIGLPETGSKILAAWVKDGKGPAKQPTYGGEGLVSSSLPGLVDPNQLTVIDGLSGTTPSAPSPEFLARLRPYASTINESVYADHSYDCMVITALAAQAAASNDPVAISKQMVAVTVGGTKCSTYAACRDLLGQGVDIDYDGASGSLDMTTVGEPSSGKYDIWRFVNGKIVTTPAK